MNADLGLNIFQVVQNELLSREGSRSTLGLGFRLAVLEERLKNHESKSKNSLVWRPHHAVAPISSLTPESKRLVDAERRRLLSRKGARAIDDKDPTMLPRHEESWEVHPDFPRTVLEFKQLQFHPDRVRSLLEFYYVKVYRPDDMRPVVTDRHDHSADVRYNLETCLEELAMTWGLNWLRIGGLALPGPSGPISGRVP
ncbi:hypothetical protein PV08_02444 [Exophiala spinifera]|uniref:Uncharacterized protein n=1 Tax=Exophiala spinifera TaxID=91928 RepID=A0A0D1YSD3_9EURO|nr:uncharacterized protein PV08_02444 [Exophiala spinifera]KIW18156.1 hypothetical protein PV08_02444 [Exophiala spinifera]